MVVGFYILMFIIGACFGSFLCCQARRLHLRSSSKPKKPSPKLNKRSICLHCKHQLRWYDNLPIVSWLLLKGKCRYCHKKIGLAELLSELGLALAFLLLSISFNLYSVTILEWAVFAIALLLTLSLGFLAIYDGLYGELPTIFLIVSIIIAGIVFALKIYLSLQTAPFAPSLILSPALAVLILGGLYLVLYLISKGKWVGDGDWLLATAIALALGTPWLALIALFLANLLACLVMYPVVKTNRKARIHLGPFLVTAFIIVYAFSIPLTNIMVQ